MIRLQVRIRGLELRRLRIPSQGLVKYPRDKLKGLPLYSRLLIIALGTRERSVLVERLSYNLQLACLIRLREPSTLQYLLGPCFGKLRQIYYRWIWLLGPQPLVGNLKDSVPGLLKSVRRRCRGSRLLYRLSLILYSISNILVYLSGCHPQLYYRLSYLYSSLYNYFRNSLYSSLCSSLRHPIRYRYFRLIQGLTLLASRLWELPRILYKLNLIYILDFLAYQPGLRRLSGCLLP